MSNEEYRFAAQLLIVVGWSITTVVWLGYSVIAPWYKISAGRYIWGLLTALFGLFSVFLAIIILDDFDFRREFILVSLLGYCFGVLGIGIGIYRAQIVRYYKAKQAYEMSHKK